MQVTALEKGLSNPNVLLASQILDEAINNFCRVEMTQKARLAKNTE